MDNNSSLLKRQSKRTTFRFLCSQILHVSGGPARGTVGIGPRGHLHWPLPPAHRAVSLHYPHAPRGCKQLVAQATSTQFPVQSQLFTEVNFRVRSFCAKSTTTIDLCSLRKTPDKPLPHLCFIKNSLLHQSSLGPDPREAATPSPANLAVFLPACHRTE